MKKFNVIVKVNVLFKYLCFRHYIWISEINIENYLSCCTFWNGKTPQNSI